ncbi:MAG: molybdate ABC transporter substrate-binding protein [Proteobacteria bacterium]|nr:molybdate ABC transporter substrate-binding protein [Pseudomonadota bacterium]
MGLGRVAKALAGALLFALVASQAFAADVTVFAATSLTEALQKVGDAYKLRTGKDVVFSFAASSALARQIEASSGGTDVYISADSDWMDYLDNRGLIAHDTRKDLLGNHLVLVAPADSNIKLSIAPHFDLVGALNSGRLAIADPDSVPAGRYAKQALSSLGVWGGVADLLVQAENVRVALAYVARGEAPLGIVYTTDAMSQPKVKIVGEFPDATHDKIVYPAALTKDARPGAKAFLDFLDSPQATAIFQKAGFVVLGDEN